MGRRTKARECAFQILYQWDLTREPVDDVVVAFWRLRSTTGPTQARANQLARDTQARLAAIDQAIAAASTHWRLERIAAVDRSILRVASFELLCEPDTPSAVILDEAVEMAKRFGEADSPAFVNGVLDAVKRRLRDGEGGEAAPAPGVKA